MKLEKHTFGSSKSCHILVDLLNESRDIKTSRRVSNFIHKINRSVDQIMYVPDLHVRGFLLSLIGKYCEGFKSKTVTDKKIQSFTRNVASINVKRAINETIKLKRKAR